MVFVVREEEIPLQTDETLLTELSLNLKLSKTSVLILKDALSYDAIRFQRALMTTQLIQPAVAALQSSTGQRRSAKRKQTGQEEKGEIPPSFTVGFTEKKKEVELCVWEAPCHQRPDNCQLIRCLILQHVWQQSESN